MLHAVGATRSKKAKDDDVVWKLCCAKAGRGGQKAVTAASGRGQGDGETGSAGHSSATKDRQFAAFSNSRGAFSSVWLKTAKSLDRTSEVNVERAVKC